MPDTPALASAIATVRAAGFKVVRDSQLPAVMVIGNRTVLTRCTNVQLSKEAFAAMVAAGEVK